MLGHRRDYEDGDWDCVRSCGTRSGGVSCASGTKKEMSSYGRGGSAGRECQKHCRQPRGSKRGGDGPQAHLFIELRTAHG